MSGANPYESPTAKPAGADAAGTPMRGPVRELTLFDTTCIIVGIIIGVGVYGSASVVAGCAPSASGVYLYWVCGGLLSLAGALCYAELAAAWPERQGGDYVYLSRAYGPWAGYLFGWGQMTIIRPGTIAQVALIFAEYFDVLLAGTPASGDDRTLVRVAIASLVVAVLTGANVLGVALGKWTQNLLTVLKAVGLAAIFVVAMFAPGVPAATGGPSGWEPRLAMILVLFAFGGWSEMSYVAAEIRNPEKNALRALVLGTLAVTLLYVLVNAAFMQALGHAGLAASKAAAIDTVATVLPGSAAGLVGALICVSALGAINGMIFTGARISYALGEEYRAFGLLGRWSPRLGTPAWALVVQGLVSLAVIVFFRSFLATIFYTTAVVWLFFLATGVALFVLRQKEPDRPRPYHVTGYPVTPIIFCASCVFLIYSAVTYNPDGSYTGLVGSATSLGVLVVGLPLYLTRRVGR